MTAIPDFNESELEIIHTTLNQRYGREIETQLADSQLILDSSKPDLTWCPTVYWEENGVGFVILKTAPARYRCQFFYSEEEQYGTGINEYNNLSDCVTTLLQIQADHEGKKGL